MSYTHATLASILAFLKEGVSGGLRSRTTEPLLAEAAGASQSPHLLARRHWLAGLCVGAFTAACGLRAAVNLKLRPEEKAPLDASVTIDEQFVGLLGYVAAHQVRLPEGEHRITVEREGYFPWDRIVVSDRKPIVLDVQMTRIPD